MTGSGASTTQHVVKSLFNGTEYTFRIRALKGSGNGGTISAEVKATPQPLPALPGDASATAIDDDSATVTWSWPQSNESLIAKFQVRHRAGNGAWESWTDVARTLRNYTVSSGLTRATAYTFEVRAVNNQNSSGPAAQAKAYTAPPKPANFAAAGGDRQSSSPGATPTTPPYPLAVPADGAKGGLLAIPEDGKVELSWSSPSDTSDVAKWQYRYRTTGAYGSWTNVPGSGSSTTSATVGSLRNATAHTFRVRAVDTSDDIVGTVLGDPTATPSTTAGWTDVANSDADTASHTVTGLTSLRIYAFQVRAVSPAGNGLPSDVATATPPAKPTEPTAIGLSETFSGSGLTGHFRLTASWTQPADTTIDGYQYRYAPTAKGLQSAAWANVAGSSRSTTSFMLPAKFRAGAAWFVQVRAVNEAGPGTASNSASVTLTPAKPNLSDLTKTFTGQDFTVGMTWPRLKRSGANDPSIASWQYRAAYGNLGVTDSTLTSELSKKAWKTIDSSGVGTVSLAFKNQAKPRYAFQVRAVNVAADGPASDVKFVNLTRTGRRTSR